MSTHHRWHPMRHIIVVAVFVWWHGSIARTAETPPRSIIERRPTGAYTTTNVTLRWRSGIPAIGPTSRRRRRSRPRVKTVSSPEAPTSSSCNLPAIGGHAPLKSIVKSRRGWSGSRSRSRSHGRRRSREGGSGSLTPW